MGTWEWTNVIASYVLMALLGALVHRLGFNVKSKQMTISIGIGVIIPLVVMLCYFGLTTTPIWQVFLYLGLGYAIVATAGQAMYWYEDMVREPTPDIANVMDGLAGVPLDNSGEPSAPLPSVLSPSRIDNHNGNLRVK